MKKKNGFRPLHLRKVKKGSRAERRQNAKPSNHKALAKIFVDYGNHLAAEDRADYLAKFFATWEVTRDNIAEVTAHILKERKTMLDAEIWKGLLAPYDVMQIFLFKPLMDRLELEEEERFLGACASLNEVWHQFFAAILALHPDLAESVSRLESARQQAHDAVRPLFTGEAKPVLNAAWGRAMLTLESEFPRLAEGLAR